MKHQITTRSYDDRSVHAHECSCGKRWEIPYGATAVEASPISKQAWEHVELAGKFVSYPTSPIMMERIEPIGAARDRPPLDPPSSFPSRRELTAEPSAFAIAERASQLTSELAQAGIAWAIADRQCDAKAAAVARMERLVAADDRDIVSDPVNHDIARRERTIDAREVATIALTSACELEAKREADFKHAARALAMHLEQSKIS